jgi:CubicO group peptidase (beta-lactamase class C family)
VGIHDAERVVASAIEDGAFPGAVFVQIVEDGIEIRSVGRVTYCSDAPPVTPQSLFDLASVSKVIGTTTMAMLLQSSSQLELIEPVSATIPEFGQNGKTAITLRHLLEHNSGLVAFRPFHFQHQMPEPVLEAIWREELAYPVGTNMEYSDLNMIVLQMVMERKTGEKLDKWLQSNVFDMVGMADTHYRIPTQSPENLERYVPTERVEQWRISLRSQRGTFQHVSYGTANDGEFIQGEVHDPTATVLGGVAGHAGLFSTAGDLARFCIALLNDQIVKGDVWRVWTRRQSNLSSRALGWDTISLEGSSAGVRMGANSFGHTGYTGTSIWIDPEANRAAILLTNRVHPTAANTKIIPLRAKFHDALWA